MRKRNRIVLKKSLQFTAALLLIVVACTDRGIVGTATETENVAGIIYTSDGKTPAKNAKVYLLPVDYNPRQGFALGTVPESTTTDANGVYKLDSVPAGTYNMLAGGGGNLAYEDSIAVVAPDIKTEVPPSSLLAPGSISGTVAMQPGDDPRTVFILVLGTFQWTWPDSAGNFTIRNMAAGVYNVRFLTILDNYMVLDTMLTITAGAADTLNRPVRMRFTGISVPSGLTISYDTLRQFVTLHWQGMAAGRPVKGYNVYRRQGAATLEKYIGEYGDTVLTDGNVLQDSSYEYRIAVLDSNGTEGVKSAAVTVKTTGAFFAFDTIGNGPGSGDGSFKQLIAMAVDRHSEAVFCVDFGNSRIQKFDSLGRYELQWKYERLFDNLYSKTVITVDSTGTLSLPDYTNGTIERFNNRGTPLGIWKDGFESPVMICISGNNIFIGEYKRGVKVLTPDGDLIRQINVQGVLSGLAATDSILYVSTSMPDYIFAYSIASGELIDTLFNNTAAHQRNQMNIWSIGSLHLSSDIAGLWAASPQEGVVIKFDFSGNVIARFTTCADSRLQDIHDDGSTIWVAMESGYIVKYRRR